VKKITDKPQKPAKAVKPAVADKAKSTFEKKTAEKKSVEKKTFDKKSLEKKSAKVEKLPPDAELTPAPVGEKLQKVLARTGIGSRREIETVIEAGHIKINDRIAKLGDRVTAKDKIFVNGQRILINTEAARRRVILYNKPEGEICSRSDPEGRPSVYDRLPAVKGERWISVGRLDFNTSGLLLFTNDGELANKLMHPSSVIDREYLVRIQGNVDDEMLRALREGVLLEDGVARFTDIVEGAGESRNRWFYCVVMEGRNREVRRLWESQGVKVSRLKRVRYGNVFIPSHVRVGQWTELTEKEIADLCLTAGFDSNKLTKIVEPSREEKMVRQRHEKKLRAAKHSPKIVKPKKN
jgi:23S rRNA pseudouridine2605 synthase